MLNYFDVIYLLSPVFENLLKLNYFVLQCEDVVQERLFR